MRTRNTHLPPEVRKAHAKEWRWRWRSKSRAGARAAFVHLREWRRKVLTCNLAVDGHDRVKR